MATKFVCAVLLWLMTVTAYAEGSPFSVNIPVDKLFDSIVNAVKSINQTVRDNSVGVLAHDLSILAGQEKGLALNLRSWQASDGSIRQVSTTDRVSVLDKNLDDIKQTYNKIIQHLNGLDPTWSRNNPKVVADIGGFAHDGIIFYCPPKRNCHVGSNGTGYAGTDGVEFFDANQVDSFVMKLEGDADQLNDLASKFASKSGSQNPPRGEDRPN